MMKSDINNEEPSTSSKTTLSKLGLCEVCAFNNAKYTCPRCQVKSCSLDCNKVHKLEVECNGQRDRTKFVPLNKYTNLDLSSDYRLLEEVTRCLESSKKKFGRRWNNLPHGLIKLQKAAKLKKVNLKFLPFKFARRRNNTTMYIAKSNTICWHIEWIFVNAGGLKISTARVPEKEKLSSTLSNCISSGNEFFKENLAYYQAAGFAGIRCLLKADQKTGKKFYELDPSSSLGECLEKKLIIEYPTIHVVLKDHANGYNVIDTGKKDYLFLKSFSKRPMRKYTRSEKLETAPCIFSSILKISVDSGGKTPDDEDIEVDERVKSGNEVVTSIIRNADDENMHESLKNLLFISEYSDEEASSDE